MNHTTRITLLTALALVCCAASAWSKPVGPGNTFCNPLNLEYRFMVDEPSRREAADPVIVLYKDTYYLFASKSGGYWYSNDMKDWTLVPIAENVLPIEDYAPAALVMDNALYFFAGTKLYKSTDPKAGKWEHVADISVPGLADPALFLDDDGRLYLYYVASPDYPIHGIELDRKTFKPIGEGKPTPITGYPKQHGWEQSGAAEWPLKAFPDGHVSTGGGPIYIEGSWMTKHNGTYYLQYAAPGTQWQIYGDGVYTSKSPLGPFTYAPNSPFSYKPSGFIGGAGHSATFKDKEGRYWHIATMVIADKHWFERRLGLFPAEFDKDGVLHVNTVMGDYPQFAPGARKEPVKGNLTGWMLLSYGKKATASSTLEGRPVGNAFDENVRSIWSAKTGDKGEWLSVDLGKLCRVSAIQVNFAEQDTTAKGRTEKHYHQYALEGSPDGQTWTMLADKSQNQKDVPHDYVALDKPVKTRFIRLTNVHVPGGGKFALRDLRVFGNSFGKAPMPVKDFTITRDAQDERNATIVWTPAGRAEGYVIRYGIAPDKLYNQYQLRGNGPLKLNCLNVGVDYWFTIDAFNDCGVSRGTVPQAGLIKAHEPVDNPGDVYRFKQ